MLAQLNASQPTFNRLPGPSLVPHLVFENPWPIVGVLMVSAAVVWFGLRFRLGERRAALCAGVLLLGAGAMWAISHRVKTDREHVIEGTRKLIDAIARPQPEIVRTLTAPGGWARAYRRWERDELIDMIEFAARNEGRYTVGGSSFAVRSYRVREIRAEVRSQRIARTQVNVVGETDSGPPTPTWFELDWDKGDDGVWRVRSVELLWDLIGGNHAR
ncbi:MAG: hypothetical protein KF866_07340 [Phycisphaeraceae bacterium]|nr:hypothetical protein [Phycisphaeraceae bacterium]